MQAISQKVEVVNFTKSLRMSSHGHIERMNKERIPGKLVMARM
jgi:hypothetical protein